MAQAHRSCHSSAIWDWAGVTNVPYSMFAALNECLQGGLCGPTNAATKRMKISEVPGDRGVAGGWFGDGVGLPRMAPVVCGWAAYTACCSACNTSHVSLPTPGSCAIG